MNKQEELQNSLERFIETSWQLGLIVLDFHPRQGHIALCQKINGLTSCLQEIDKLKPSFAANAVHAEVFDYIDQARNPELFTRDCVERAADKCKSLNAKTEAFKRFHALLLLELSKEFPNEVAKYRYLSEDLPT